MRSLAGWIERHAAFTPTKLALRCGKESLTYAALSARIATLVDWLEGERRLIPGARVAWLGHNCLDMLALLFACAHTRTMFLPLNWRLSARELNEVLDDAGVSLLIIDRSCAAQASNFEHRTPVMSRFSKAGFACLPAGPSAAVLLSREVEADTPVLLVYTSGTTGRAKGVVLSQQALLFNALNAIHMHAMSAADRVLTVLPMFHVGGLNIQTLPALYCGAEVIVEERFDAHALLERLNARRPSLTTLVPTMIDALSNTPGWEEAALECLRCVTTGSTDVPLPLIAALHARRVPVIQIYGASETGPVAIYQRIDDAFDGAGSIGRAGLHTDVRLVDSEGKDVPDGKGGEILVRGAHVATGYWDRERGCAVPFSGGWFASGDVALRDQDGCYWFKDRIKNIIISGGENIYAAELDRILDSSAAVREAAVAGRRDARWGEVPVVVAVRAGPHTDKAAVLGLFADRIASYKRPRDVVFVDAIPRNAMGKVDVAELRAIVNRAP